MTTSTIIFNQYYYELLTKIRTIAKKHKDNSSTASKVLDVMKDNYKEFDKTSGEYVEFVKENCNDDFWKSYLEVDKDKCDEWLKNEDIKKVYLFKDISIGEISKLLRDNFLCHHFLSVFYIYKNEMSDESASTILKILQTFSDEFELENEEFKKVITRLNNMKTDKVKENSSFEGMGELKETTIGKIAKEIIEDVNIDKFKQTINEEGDILKALANPENGLGELFSKVGNKVTDKISSGELNQDAIMKDAMKFASMLPSMFGNNGGGGNGDFNMADMMKMMSAMNAGGGGGKKSKTAINKQGLKALAKRAELQKKLSSKK
jgi:ribosomal protein S17E